jgi:hypothetical protein
MLQLLVAQAIEVFVEIGDGTVPTVEYHFYGHVCFGHFYRFFGYTSFVSK